MSRDADVSPIYSGGIREHAQRALGVVQALSHQRVTIEQSVGHRAVMPQPVIVLRLDALHSAPSILERHGIGSQNGNASPGEGGPER